MEGVVFGGEVMAEVDITCGELCRRALYNSEVKEAFTHKAEFEFIAPPRLGDILFMDAELVELRKKALVIKFKAWVERCGTGEVVDVAFGKLVWVSHIKGAYHNHGLEM